MSVLWLTRKREKNKTTVYFMQKKTYLLETYVKKNVFSLQYTHHIIHILTRIYTHSFHQSCESITNCDTREKKKKRISKSEPVDLPDCQDKIERSPHSQSLSSTKLDVAGGSSLPIFVTSPILSDVCDGVPLSRAVL